VGVSFLSANWMVSPYIQLAGRDILNSHDKAIMDRVSVVESYL
jgi:hypothetical protein